jgi:hypothetical protein
MGASVEETEVGGGEAQGLGADFAKFLQQALRTGEFGNTAPNTDELDRRIAELEGSSARGAVGAAQQNALAGLKAERERVIGEFGSGPAGGVGGIAQALNDLVSGPDVTGIQSAVQEIIQKQSTRDVADLRERFTAGGGSQGTPSAVAEGLFRSELAPKLASVTGQLDLAASQQQIQGLIPILQSLQGFASRGVSQRTAGAVVKPGILSDVAGLAQGVGEIVPG